MYTEERGGRETCDFLIPLVNIVPTVHRSLGFSLLLVVDYHTEVPGILTVVRVIAGVRKSYRGLLLYRACFTRVTRTVELIQDMH